MAEHRALKINSIDNNNAAIKDEESDLSNSESVYVNVKNCPEVKQLSSDIPIEAADVKKEPADVKMSVEFADVEIEWSPDGVKQELDIGLTVLQPPDVHAMPQPCKLEPAGASLLAVNEVVKQLGPLQAPPADAAPTVRQRVPKRPATILRHLSNTPGSSKPERRRRMQTPSPTNLVVRMAMEAPSYINVGAGFEVSRTPGSSPRPNLDYRPLFGNTPAGRVRQLRNETMNRITLMQEVTKQPEPLQAPPVDAAPTVRQRAPKRPATTSWKYEEAKSKKRVTTEQQEQLISLLADHAELASGRWTGKYGRISYHEQWQAIADRLNSVGSGVKKDVEKWQQTWKDWKGNLKKKVARIRHEQSKTGGDKSEVPLLSPLEERILAITGIETATGAEDVPDTVPEAAETRSVETDCTWTVEITQPSEVCSNATSPFNVENSNVETTVSELHTTKSRDNLQSTPITRKMKKTKTAEHRYLEILEGKRNLQERQMELEERRLQLEQDRLQFERERAEIERERVHVERERAQIERERAEIERERVHVERERLQTKPEMLGDVCLAVTNLLGRIADIAQRYLERE